MSFFITKPKRKKAFRSIIHCVKPD